LGGYTTLSTETIRGSDTFSIPCLHGELYAFEVEENSMTPNINHGDMVICREWNQQYDELRKDAAYVIITSDGARVKRLERKYENYEFTQWILKSDNPTISKDYIDIANVTSIFLVVRVLSLYSFNELSENQAFNANEESVTNLMHTISDNKKEDLRYKISNNRISDAINELIRLTDRTGEKNNLLILKSRIRKLKSDQIIGCLPIEDENREINRITKGLLDYIDLLD
jgi:Peptidase S24-like/Effector-associated domain 11